MKRIIIILILFICNLNLETHSFNINDYSFPSNNVATLIKDVSNHYNQDFWFIKYVFDVCSNYNVDPLLMVALIKVESSFIPTALSRKNAYGYCQITPIANKDVDPTLNRYNVKDNIILGVRFIDKLLDKFDGDIVKALRYYNAGNSYDVLGKTYAENIKYEYDTMVNLYLKDEDSYKTIYRKEAF
ncbi:lytic transglycosylase domain-containing protein [uncultured Brachyspira sp.]|nr:transglycosylase SLT domain-containing protein [uncultured Brachyspira sp.]